jgi:hypothetical protein
MPQTIRSKRILVGQLHVAGPTNISGPLTVAGVTQFQGGTTTTGTVTAGDVVTGDATVTGTVTAGDVVAGDLTNTGHLSQKIVVTTSNFTPVTLGDAYLYIYSDNSGGSPAITLPTTPDDGRSYRVSLTGLATGTSPFAVLNTTDQPLTFVTLDLTLVTVPTSTSTAILAPSLFDVYYASSLGWYIPQLVNAAL